LRLSALHAGRAGAGDTNSAFSEGSQGYDRSIPLLVTPRCLDSLRVNHQVWNIPDIKPEVAKGRNSSIIWRECPHISRTVRKDFTKKMRAPC
jgi:hypothetical protein